ncbi:MTHFS family protein [Megaselia abdita]
MSKIVQNSLKVTLRKELKEKIKQIPLESRKTQSNHVTKKILQTDEFKNAKGISLYLSTSGEVDTTEILKVSFQQNKAVFVPTYSGNVMEMVRLNSWEDYDNLPLTKWNIKQPELDNIRENAMEGKHNLDLFLMPGVGFTTKGERMGHGMGYYDKYLTRYFNKFGRSGTKLFALAFDEQIVDELPTDPHDVLLDKIFYSSC